MFVCDQHGNGSDSHTEDISAQRQPAQRDQHADHDDVARRALAYHRLGKTDDAKKWWNEAKRWLAENPRPSATPWQDTLPMHPHDWLGCLLLRREAEACFGDAKPGGKPADTPPAAK